MITGREPRGQGVLSYLLLGALAIVVFGSMGGAAICYDLRLEESGDRQYHVPVLILLDRRADVFIAKHSGAEGWLVKPLDPLRLRRATAALLGGGTYFDDSYQPVPVLVGEGPREPTGGELTG